MPVCTITPEFGPYPALWQVEHTIVVGMCPIGGVVRLAIRKVVVDVWQAEQSELVDMCVVGASFLVLGVTPTAKVCPLWHCVQLLTMPAWFIIDGELAGAGGIKNPPGLVWVGEWQSSHGMLVGTWPDGMDLGVTPTKLWPLWQLAHPVTMPVWFITPGTKLAWLWHSEQACWVGR